MQSVLSLPGPEPTKILGVNGRFLRFALDPLRYASELFERYGRIAFIPEGR